MEVHASRVHIYKCPSKLNTAYPCKIYWPFLDVWVHQKVDSSTLKVTWETRATPKYQFLDNNNLNKLLTGNTIKHSIFKTFITFLYAKQEYPFNHFFVLFSPLFSLLFLPFPSLLSWLSSLFAHLLPFSITTCLTSFSHTSV